MYLLPIYVWVCARSSAHARAHVFVFGNLECPPHEKFLDPPLVSLQSPEVQQSVSWGPTSYGYPLTQRAFPARIIGVLEKGVLHSHVGYHCTAQRLKNLFLGVPHLMDAP